MPLTVLSIAFPFAPVGPGAVGGSEQVLSDIDAALVSAGHRSVVVACEGSETRGELYPVPLSINERLDDEARRRCREQFQATIDRVLRSNDIDVIHMHGMDFDQYSLSPNIPVVVTLHMPIDWYERNMWDRFPGRVQFVCVSESQRQTCPQSLREDVTVVLNGVELPAFDDAGPKQDYAIALGRICPEKNFHEALEAGTLAKTRVLLGGQVFPYEEHQRYFNEKIQPLLAVDGKDVKHEFLGPIGAARRQQLLAQARCLLHPTLAPETSSLVAMEALAAGTPVIAYRSGALTEIVEDGVTGLLVNGVEEMAEAIRRVDAISPAACRSAAERRFSVRNMVRGYFDLYEQMKRQNSPEPAYA